MKKLKFNSKKHAYDVELTNENLEEMFMNNYCEKLMQNAEASDVDINHLEKIFTNETYYFAMKIVPLVERKILYLSYIENLKLDDISRRLKLSKKRVISLRNKGIVHFKNNLNTLNIAKKLGGKL